MLAFSVWGDDARGRTVYIDPSAVVCMVEDSRRRGYGGYSEVTDITLSTGDKLTVCGHVGREVNIARAADRVAQEKRS